MKITPEDITPELLHAALREMVADSATPQQKEIGNAITGAMKTELCEGAIWAIVDHIVDTTESCYQDGLCFCQARIIFAIAFTCGVKMCNARQDVKELEKLNELG